MEKTAIVGLIGIFDRQIKRFFTIKCYVCVLYGVPFSVCKSFVPLHIPEKNKYFKSYIEVYLINSNIIQMNPFELLLS